MRAAQCTHADECYGRAGMQRGMCCVLEAHMVQIVYMITVAGCLHQRREQMDGADAAQRPARGWVRAGQVLYVRGGIHLMFLRRRSAGGARSRLPLRTAMYPSWVPLFTPPLFIHTNFP